MRRAAAARAADVPHLSLAGSAAARLFGTELWILRLFQGVVGVAAFLLYQALFRLRYPDAGGDRLLLLAWNPLVFPFFVLVYTDVAALTAVLAGVYFQLRGRHLLAAGALLLACLLRQSSLLWVVFLAAWRIADLWPAGDSNPGVLRQFGALVRRERLWLHGLVVAIGASVLVGFGGVVRAPFMENRPAFNVAQFYLFGLTMLACWLPQWGTALVPRVAQRLRAGAAATVAVCGAHRRRRAARGRFPERPPVESGAGISAQLAAMRNGGLVAGPHCSGGWARRVCGDPGPHDLAKPGTTHVVAGLGVRAAVPRAALPRRRAVLHRAAGAARSAHALLADRDPAPGRLVLPADARSGHVHCGARARTAVYSRETPVAIGHDGYRVPRGPLRSAAADCGVSGVVSMPTVDGPADRVRAAPHGGGATWVTLGVAILGLGLWFVVVMLARPALVADEVYHVPAIRALSHEVPPLRELRATTGVRSAVSRCCRRTICSRR